MPEFDDIEEHFTTLMPFVLNYSVHMINDVIIDSDSFRSRETKAGCKLSFLIAFDGSGSFMGEITELVD